MEIEGTTLVPKMSWLFEMCTYRTRPTLRGFPLVFRMLSGPNNGSHGHRSQDALRYDVHDERLGLSVKCLVSVNSWRPPNLERLCKVQDVRKVILRTDRELDRQMPNLSWR